VKKEKMMKCLEELEEKVLHVVHKNKELSAQLGAFVKENNMLREQKQHAETALLKEVSTSNALAQDKVQIKTTIEELLSSIALLENS
jgi:hypothetical protein